MKKTAKKRTLIKNDTTGQIAQQLLAVFVVFIVIVLLVVVLKTS